jgi:predicted transcriptional regulator
MSTSDLPLSEITLRKFERPESLDRKTLIRRFCISLGLVQPGETRVGLIDIFSVLLTSPEPLRAEEISEKLGGKLALSGIRRHLRRLEQTKLIEHRNMRYSLAESGDLVYCLNFVTKKYLIEDTFERIVEYAEKLKNG